MQDILPPDVPIISVSKGLELGTGSMMSELIPQALGRRHPAAFLSGPSFAKEVMDKQPTGFVAASKVHQSITFECGKTDHKAERPSLGGYNLLNHLLTRQGSHHSTCFPR